MHVLLNEEIKLTINIGH